jgi:hypothetical protein
MNDVTTNKRRRGRREIRPDTGRRTSAPFNGKTVDRTVPDPYSPTGCEIVVSGSLPDDPCTRRHIDGPQYRIGLFCSNGLNLLKSARRKPSTRQESGRRPGPKRRAHNRLSATLAFVRSVLDPVGYDLSRQVLAGHMFRNRLPPRQASQRSIDFWARRFGKCLQTLAIALGARGKRKRRATTSV